MAWTADQIASELDGIAAFDEALEKRITRLLRNCPPDVRAKLEDTSLGSVSLIAADAKRVADELVPPIPMKGAA